MVSLALRAVVALASAAVGILVAVFAVLQVVLSPLVVKVVERNAKAFLGGTDLLDTFLALWVASLWGDGLEISGVGTWVAATVVVWLATALATLLLPVLLARVRVRRTREQRGT